ncbi:PAS domain-containing methyl-accepting chemotaxis protein [Sulfitobacter sp. LCG007]
MFRKSPPAKNSAQRELEALEASHAIVRFSMDGTITEVNDTFCRNTGFEQFEICGKHHGVLLRQNDRDKAQLDATWRRLREGENVTAIVPRIRNGEVLHWIDVTYAPVLNDAGEPEYVVGISKDITEMHQRRLKNRSEADAVRRAMAVIEFDLEGNILAANEAFLTTAGYSLEEIVGKHHRIFCPKEVSESPDYPKFWADLAKGATVSGQVKRIRKDGEVVWLEATYATLTDPDGVPYKIIKFAYDVTEVKNREADVEAQLRAIQTVQAVIEFKPDGTIIRANDIFCGALGYEPNELPGKKHSLFVTPEYAGSQEYRDFWEKLRAGKTHSGEYVRVAKDGKNVYIRASYNPITDASGRVVKVVKFAIDTTVFEVATIAMRNALKSLADGNLDTRVNEDLGDFDAIRHTYNDAVARIGSVMLGVLHQSGEILSEMKGITDSCDQLSTRTERQAATLEESAAALEELTASVKSAAEVAKQARGQAEKAMSETEQSNGVVSDAVQAMNEIADSSKKISSITSVIDDIAFQTNLLALNAGVEAARAGDAGRGFAVVASEVRGLAQRSSEAAQEIAGLIEASSNQVARGVDLVGKTGESLKSIEDVVRSISESIINMATSSQEQASGLGDMNNAVGELDRVTQQNAGMAEEINSAVRMLLESIQKMQKEVQFFEVTDPQARGGSNEDCPSMVA